jgi:hypothetical protein
MLLAETIACSSLGPPFARFGLEMFQIGMFARQNKYTPTLALHVTNDDVMCVHPVRMLIRIVIGVTRAKTTQDTEHEYQWQPPAQDDQQAQDFHGLESPSC